MKLTSIGGGSYFTPLLLKGLAGFRDEIKVDQIALLDINQPNVERVAAYCRKLFDDIGLYPVDLVSTIDHQLAIEGSDFIIFTIRVGGLPARVQDEKIPLKYGIGGDETMGPGGFANALRTIPVMVAYAQEIERWAPDAWVIPFTNPEGILTEAILRHSHVKAIGLCTAPFGLLSGIARHLGVSRSSIMLDYIGLTHLGWVSAIRLDGRDILPEVVQTVLVREDYASPYYPADMLVHLKTIPAHWFFTMVGRDYPHWFYHHRQVVEKQRSAPKTRAEELIAMQQELANRDFLSIPIQELEKKRRHQVLDEPVLSLISAIWNNKDEVHILDIPNGGCVPGFEPEMVIEMPARVTRSGATPFAIQDLAPEVRGLMQMLKAYEQLTIRAAMSGSYDAAIQALLPHPIVMAYDIAKPLLDDILEANRPFLPDYWADTVFKKNG
jgi:6-phospho-beta-glucosidase